MYLKEPCQEGIDCINQQPVRAAGGAMGVTSQGGGKGVGMARRGG